MELNRLYESIPNLGFMPFDIYYSGYEAGLANVRGLACI